MPPTTPRAALVALLVILAASLHPAAAEVYIKLLPGKELCLSYEGYRDPEDDPPTVDIRHRALEPRNVNIRTHLYGPNGKLIPLQELFDPLGTPASIFFKVEETGTYRLCLRTPLSHPPLPFELRFVGENDLIDPTTTTEGMPVVDKPVEVKDYNDRLKMLEICVEVILDEVRIGENRLQMINDITKTTYYATVGMLFLNVALSIGLSVWAEKYLERFFIKKKIV